MGLIVWSPIIGAGALVAWAAGWDLAPEGIWTGYVDHTQMVFWVGCFAWPAIKGTSLLITFPKRWM